MGAAEHRVLVLAPRGRDAKVAAGILAKAGVASVICDDIRGLVAAAVEGAGAALVTEEALDDHDETPLLRWVAEQPPWSDFPFVILTAPRSDIARGAHAPAWFEGIGNAVMVERPLGAAALASTVRVALRARQRQYEMRTYLSEREQAAATLATMNASLEMRVGERTAELQSAYDRLETEARERQQAEARLAQAQRMEALGQLAGGIAHDFNNVLQAVVSGLSLIHRRPGDADAVKRYAQMAGTAAERGASITGRLLSFARKDALQAESVAPALLLEGLREMLKPTLGAGIDVGICTTPDLPPLSADKGQLETVLVNLAVNARDAMPGGGKLLFAAAVENVTATPHVAGLLPGTYLRIDVCDTGVGMSAATLARASEPFFTTKAIGQGTGLGLAMARGFAHQSGGGFAIASTPGEGTTVTLWFPEAAAAPTVSEDIARDDYRALSTAAPVRLLIVDDDSMVREALVAQMEGQGYSVAQAVDGLHALAQLDDGAPVDLLISDFAMPGMNGLTLIREVRHRRPELPAILLTGYAEAGVPLAVAEGRAEITALLRKPIASDELNGRIATLLHHATMDSRLVAER